MTEMRADDNLNLAQMLRDARGNVPNNIKLPGAIAFYLANGTVRMHMAGKCVLANMQDNTSSFEGWALSFKRWLAGVDRVELTWDSVDKNFDPHYQRFLFRVQQFLLLFPGWFAVTDAGNRHDLGCLKTESAKGALIVTSPKKVRDTADNHKSANMMNAITNEHKLECYIKDHPDELMQLLGCGNLDRQFPVGLFDGKVDEKCEIFPRGHSAVDLWAVRNQSLLLFELKARGNTRVGVLSELFFYAYIMHGVQVGRYKLQDVNERISLTTMVRAFILAPELHPLVDEGILRMANSAFKAIGWHIRFGIIQIHPERETFSLLMPAEDEETPTT